jgi:hypothetical protein
MEEKMNKTISIGLVLIIALIFTVAVSANGNTMTIVSDKSVDVYGPSSSYIGVGDASWGTPNSAVATWVHSSWPWKTDPDGAIWISNSYYIGEPIAASSWRWFTKSVDLCQGAYNIVGNITATADNAEDVYVNGNLIGSDGEVQDPWGDDYEWGTVLDYPFTVASADTLTLDFIVRNYPGSTSPTANPTGLIFKATVTYDCPIEVDIDIKPGSDPSCFNNDGHGVIPVAILGSADFDVYTVDPGTVQLEGLAVAAKGKSNKLLAAYEDVNGDGFTDLVIKIEDADGTFTQGSGYATLMGNLYGEYGGTPIQGTGDICITQ